MRQIKNLFFPFPLSPFPYPFKKAFTLIELLVTITLVAIIGIITSQVFILGLNSQGKAEIIKEVKQNGDHTISTMENMIRNAVDISGDCNNKLSLQSLTIVNPDGLTTTFACADNKIVSISGLSGGEQQPGVPLTNDRVVVDNCKFHIICPTPPLSPKYVYLVFTVRQPGEAVPVENSASLDYQTTVSLRRYETY